MRKLLPLISLFILLSCQSKKDQQGTGQPPVPEALQEQKKSMEFSKRGPGNLVDELYAEKLNSSEELQKLEVRIDELTDIKNDSVTSFIQFKLKNETYFDNASVYVNRIQDSLLKKEMAAIFSRAFQKYNGRIADLASLLTLLESKTTPVADRYNILKLLISLGMMDQYQQDNLPSAKPMESVAEKANKIISSLDSAITKNK
jgi:hypothetical protein